VGLHRGTQTALSGRLAQAQHAVARLTRRAPAANLSAAASATRRTVPTLTAPTRS
jgi:hypothetical protein